MKSCEHTVDDLPEERMEAVNPAQEPATEPKTALATGAVARAQISAVLVISLMLLSGCRRHTEASTSIEFHYDVTYATVRGHELKLDVCRPRQRMSQTLPALLFFHGGGWREGDKKFCNDDAMEQAHRGFVVFNANYRLTTVARYPAQIEDAERAYRWIREHAGEYGADPERIGVWGNSAGGHLALMLACRPLSKDVQVGAASSWFGPTDFLVSDWRDATRRQGYVVEFLGGTQRELPELYREVSPIQYVHENTPPILLVHGQDDLVVPWTQSRAMHEALLKAGATAKLLTVLHAQHKLNPTPGHEIVPDLDSIHDRTAAFFHQHLGDS